MILKSLPKFSWDSRPSLWDLADCSIEVPDYFAWVVGVISSPQWTVCCSSGAYIALLQRRNHGLHLSGSFVPGRYRSNLTKFFVYVPIPLKHHFSKFELIWHARTQRNLIFAFIWGNVDSTPLICVIRCLPLLYRQIVIVRDFQLWFADATLEKCSSSGSCLPIVIGTVLPKLS